MLGVFEIGKRLATRRLAPIVDGLSAAMIDALANPRAQVGFDLMPTNIPQEFFAGQKWAAFATKVGGGRKEVIREPLYSMKVYAAAGQTQLTFFDQSFGVATNGYGDTNMQAPNFLPAGEGFLATNLRVTMLPARADYDGAAGVVAVSFGEVLEALIRNCWLEFWILSKPYLRVGPLAFFPAGFGPPTTVAGVATVTRIYSWAGNGSPDSTALFLLDPPLLIQPLDNFYALMNWRAVLTWTTAGKAAVHLDGYHIRNPQ